VTRDLANAFSGGDRATTPRDVEEVVLDECHYNERSQRGQSGKNRSFIATACSWWAALEHRGNAAAPRLDSSGCWPHRWWMSVTGRCLAFASAVQGAASLLNDERTGCTPNCKVWALQKGGVAREEFETPREAAPRLRGGPDGRRDMLRPSISIFSAGRLRQGGAALGRICCQARRSRRDRRA